MKLLPQRDGKLIKIRRRLQPRFPVAIGPVDAHPLARRRLAEVDGVVTVISRPPRRRQSFAVDRPLDFRDGVDDDRVVLDGHNVVKIPVAQQVQIPLFNFPFLRLGKRPAANKKKKGRRRISQGSVTAWPSRERTHSQN